MDYLFEIKKAEVIEQLLQMNVKELKLELDNGWTLLHHCAKEGIVTPTILRALEHQVNSMDSTKKSPVDYLGQELLFQTKDAEVIEQLLRMKVKGLKLELDNGWTLLHHCVKEGIVTPTILRKLEHQVNSMDSRKKTPINYADMSENGRQLLHQCVKEGILSSTIVRALAHLSLIHI